MKTLLNIEETAKELNIDALALKRVIARGHLRATRLGATREWRITREDLNRYVAAGATDIEHPPWGERGLWYDDDLKFSADTYWRQAMEEFRLQRVEYSESERQKLIDSQQKQGSMTREIELSITASVKALGEQPVLAVARPLPGKLAPAYKTLLEAYAVREYRRTLQLSIKKLTGKEVPRFLYELFANVDAYNGLIADAREKLSARKLEFSEGIGHRGREVRLRYCVEHGKLLGTALLNRLPEISL